MKIAPGIVQDIEEGGILAALVREWFSLRTEEERDEFYTREFMSLSVDEFERFTCIALMEMEASLR